MTPPINVTTAPLEAPCVNNHKLPDFGEVDLDISQFRLAPEPPVPLARKQITEIPVRRPKNEVWIRTHEDSNDWFNGLLISLQSRTEVYLVHPTLASSLTEEPACVRKVLVPFLTRQGDLGLWPIKLPDASGSLDPWNSSALDIATQARSEWVRVLPNQSAGCYQHRTMTAAIAEPIWPELSVAQMIQLAFRGHTITALEHPVLAELRGEK